MTDDPLAIARTLGAALDRVGAAWAVGGSMASSVHGIPRTTADLDLIVALRPSLAAAFAREAQGFFVDVDTLRAQLHAGRAYNVFHESTMTKIDLFPAVGAFERNQLARASVYADVRVVSAEDSVLAKLRWFRAGEERSDRQWRDVLGVIEVQRAHLDLEHLAHWADALGVADLLTRALSQDSGGL